MFTPPSVAVAQTRPQTTSKPLKISKCSAISADTEEALIPLPNFHFLRLGLWVSRLVISGVRIKQSNLECILPFNGHGPHDGVWLGRTSGARQRDIGKG